MHVMLIAVALLVSVFCSVMLSAEPVSHQRTAKIANSAFSPGEKLTYSLSWLTLVDAGVATMEVKDSAGLDLKKQYRINCSVHSVGMLESLFPIRLSTESLVSAPDMNGISFQLQEQYGSKKRSRKFAFDHEKHTVLYRANEDPEETNSVPSFIQDALSPIYYLRIRDDFIVDKPIRLTVFEKGKIWSVDVHMLGKEKIKTPLGEFDTIKIKTYLAEGIFPNVGDIFIWLTDDERKIPLLVKCKLKVAGVGMGSLVATLTKIEPGKIENDKQAKPQAAQ